MIRLFNQLAEEWCVILFRCFRWKGNWYIIVLGNWPRNELIVSALASSVKLASRRGCSLCNYRLLKGFISYRNLFDFLFWSVPVSNHKNMVCKYTLASLNFTFSVSEYVTINVTAKPVTFLREPNPCCTVVSHMCSCKTITVSRK